MSTELEQLNKSFKKEEKSVFGFFVRNFRFTYLIILAILFLGFYSISIMPREADPEIKVPYAMVNTIYPGANPVDVEELVTNELEDKIENLDNINKFNSNSSLGLSSIFVEFEAEAEIESSMEKLREQVDLAKQNLPDASEDPVITQISITDFPIVTYSLVGDYSSDNLKQYADILRDKFLSNSDISKVIIIGAEKKEFQILVDQTKLSSFNLSLHQIASAIRSTNLNMPAGDIEVDGLKYNISLRSKIKNLEELKSIIIATHNNSTIYLTDVASIVYASKEQKTLSKIGVGKSIAKNTISLQVFKKTGGNILDIVKNTKLAIDDLKSNNILPNDLKVIKTNDNAKYIKKNLQTLGTSGAGTMILIILILFIAIGFKSSLITSLSVPIAFLMAFVFLYINGMTLNGMVLFSLVLSLGLMVDNSIVIIEGINEYTKKYNQSIYRAAMLSVWNYKWPIIAGTLTTVSAFLPMLLVSGIMGEYLSIMPITISATLLSSLFVALIIIPTISYRFINKVNYEKKNCSICEQFINKIKIKYENFLRLLLFSKLKRRLFLLSTWILFALSIYIPASGKMQIEMFPRVDVDYFVVNIELPAGSILEETKYIATKVEKKIKNIPELDNFVTNLGTSASIGITGDDYSQDATHLAAITVNLVDSKVRDRKSYAISDDFRKQLSSIKGAKINVEELSTGPPQGAPIEIRIVGDKLEELLDVSEQVKETLSNIDGVINIKDSLRGSPGELVYTFDKVKLNYYGLDAAGVSAEVRSAIHGINVSELQYAGEDVSIIVKYEHGHFDSIEKIKNLVILNMNGKSITLGEVATLELKPAFLSISHKDGDSLVTLRASLREGINLSEVLKQFNVSLNNIDLPAGVRVETGGEVEDIDKSFRETFLSMIVAVILIAIILVLIFNSFVQPFIIILSLPLAVIGVVFGLLVLNMPFSFTSFIGIVALSGIVVNDAIVLIDRINKNIKRGVTKLEAVTEAGVARAHPIFLTSITTISGIIPLVWADEMWRGFSVAIIFGLAFATILTLVIIPIMYISLVRDK